MGGLDLVFDGGDRMGPDSRAASDVQDQSDSAEESSEDARRSSSKRGGASKRTGGSKTGRRVKKNSFAEGPQEALRHSVEAQELELDAGCILSCAVSASVGS